MGEVTPHRRHRRRRSGGLLGQWRTGLRGRFGPLLRRKSVRRALIGVVVLAIVGVSLDLSLHTTSVPIAPVGTHGYDVSWPQCSGSSSENMPAGTPAYVILGLSDVRDHTVNPCVADQLKWAHDHGVRVGAYLLASYPTAQQQTSAPNCARAVQCELRADGAAQAREALATMAKIGLHAPRVWLDIEVRTVNPWSHKRSRNAALIKGVLSALRAAHVGAGIYSTAYQWHKIAGNTKVDVPNWLPVGAESASSASAMCTSTATGGPTWLVQYTEALDEDLTCPILDLPGVHATLSPSGGQTKSQRDLQLSRFVRPS